MERLRVLFEGREAIYVEKGALRVKVTNIHRDVAQQYVSAEVEEIPTTGLPVGMFHSVKQHEPSPLRWTIGGGYLTTFSDNTSKMGYGGWSLFFAPSIVEGIQNIALWFPDNLDPFQRYERVLDYLKEHGAYEPTLRLFEEREPTRPEILVHFRGSRGASLRDEVDLVPLLYLQFPFESGIHVRGTGLCCEAS